MNQVVGERRKEEVVNSLNLLDTTVDIDPVVVGYNIASSEVQDFMLNYLSNVKGIDGVQTVRCVARKTGNRNPEIAVYAFFSLDSQDITSKLANIPSSIREHFDPGNLRASDRLWNVLKPIVKDNRIFQHAGRRLAYVKLHEFRVLAMMLAADSRRHDIAIVNVIQSGKKKNSTITVLKSLRYMERDDNGYDVYSEIIDREED